MEEKCIYCGSIIPEGLQICPNCEKEVKSKTINEKLKPCPHCQKAWLYVSDGDYYSDYESKGYRVNCSCGYAWKTISWQETEQEAIQEWNRRVKKELKGEV